MSTKPSVCSNTLAIFSAVSRINLSSVPYNSTTIVASVGGPDGISTKRIVLPGTIEAHLF